MKPEISPVFTLRRGCLALSLLLLLLPLQSIHAQALHSGRAGSGITLYEAFDGSAGGSGAMLRMSNDVGFEFRRLVGFDLVLPIYFAIPPVQQPGFSSATPSLGSLSVGAHMSLPLPLVEYTPALTIGFPTGSVSKGLSTGAVTYDLDNHFQHGFALVPLAPFLDADIGNSQNNGNGPFHSHVQMPFLTFGKMAEVKAGLELQLLDDLTATADGYDIVPWGPQTMYSRILRPGSVGTGGAHNRAFELFPITDGGPGLTRDSGYEISVGYNPRHFLHLRFLDLTAGYSHSMRYDLNTVSLGLGINVSQLLSRRAQ